MTWDTASHIPMFGCYLFLFLSLFPFCVSASVTLFFSLPLIHLQLYILVSPSSARLSVCPSISQPLCLTVCLPLYLSSSLLTLYISIHCMLLYQPACLSIYSSLYLACYISSFPLPIPTYLSAFLSTCLPSLSTF